MKVIKLKQKEKQKKELYNMLSYVPKPSARYNLTTSQKYWWNWFARELIKTGKFAKLDQMHLAKAAYWLDVKNQSIKKQNDLNQKNPKTLPGYVQVYVSGATNVSPWVTLVEKADKHLDEISSHFGLSIRDRNRLKEPPVVDENQTDLFKDFLNQKTM